jgi:hypothetical protein
VAVIGFEETVYNASESDGEIEVFVAVLQGVLSGPVVVRISTMDGSAISGSDYQSIDQLLTFDQSTTRIAVNVPLFEDDIDEDLEILQGVLVLESSDSGRAPAIDPKQAQLNIADNDSTPSIQACFVLLWYSNLQNSCHTAGSDRRWPSIVITP